MVTRAQGHRIVKASGYPFIDVVPLQAYIIMASSDVPPNAARSMCRSETLAVQGLQLLKDITGLSRGPRAQTQMLCF